MRIDALNEKKRTHKKTKIERKKKKKKPLYGVCEEKIYLKSDQPNGSKNKDQFGLFNDDDDNGVR